MFRPAVNEVIVGKGASKQFKNTEIGSQIKTRFATWVVVGTFTSNGDAHESEVITDRDTLSSAFRGGANSSVTVVLNSPAAFDQFKDALSTNPAVSVDVMREREYYARQSETLTRLLSWVAYVVGSIMAIGAFFGALNAMYSRSVRGRGRSPPCARSASAPRQPSLPSWSNHCCFPRLAVSSGRRSLGCSSTAIPSAPAARRKATSYSTSP